MPQRALKKGPFMFKRFIHYLTGHDHAAQAVPTGALAPAQPQRSRQAGTLIDLPLASLQVQRQALDNQQRGTFEDLQGFQADSQGIVARYATARVNGRPTELQALERVYTNVKTRLRAAELRHADQLSLLTLTDRVCALREDLQAREGLQQSALAGMGIEQLRQMLGDELAKLLQNRQQVQDVLDDMDVHDDDAQLQAQSAMVPVRDELMALTEREVHQAIDAQLAPLADVAAELDQRMAVRARPARQGTATSVVGKQEATR